MNRLLSLHIIIVFSGINCSYDNNNNEVEDSDGKYNSKLKEPISTPEDLFNLNDGKDVFQKLVRLLTDAEYRNGRNKALKTITPKKDPLKPRILDDDILDLIPDPPKMPKIHIHHVFPPHLIRPLQKVIIEKMINHIKNDPVKKIKRKVKRVSRLGTVAVGLGLGIRELKELKSHPPTANYKVTGVIDLSQKRKTYHNSEYLSRYKRSEDELVEDTDDPDYKTVKDYKLIGPEQSGNRHWPFHESKEEIYEKWNKFPVPKHPDPFHQKVKYIHRSFHDLHPDLLHIVKDVEGLIGHKKEIISAGPDLEHPIVLAGQLVKLADSLIPSIRIRIPFLEYLKKSFHEKSKPKVVYVKQPPKIKYVGLPYKEEEETMPSPEPLQINVPITVPVVEPIIVPERVPYPEVKAEVSGQYRRQMDPELGNGNYDVITNMNMNEQAKFQPNTFVGKPNYDSQPPNQHRYAQMFEQAVRLYQDKKGAKA